MNNYFKMLLFISIALSFTNSLHACATVSAKVPVEIADESAIIIWDEENKIQHFIRRASFQTEAEHFGFLVPTPTQPTLEKASDIAFSILGELTAATLIERQRSFGISWSRLSMVQVKSKSARSVRVLEKKRVSIYEVAVLEADSATALKNWLQQHEYQFPKNLKQWIQPYIDKGWKISAFKIAKDVDKKQIATSAVRMSFATERPFFPYREPQHANNEKTTKRLLRVYFLSNNYMQGTLGEEGKWPGKEVWAGPISTGHRNVILESTTLSMDTKPHDWQLTEFEDYSSYRPSGADVYFSNSSNQKQIRRPPQIVYVYNRGDILFNTIVYTVIIIFFLRYKRKR
ncbi:DUF2330 domain-containing protein [Candidatus Uabimicrobium amorphum]|uniref:DUF2330 domain-containing protein n=1 Tax=Uabimicrobium amorphum TaxID=2596890 RepID=A0A5S9ISA8_UABAM|nr:DUF2330 domain-containing protein [Candidatus Uabimicrobium amorphum]BBM86620.1 hypothetical protein UABAM_05006 [Candidatus Uabimicrobium amorphum]